jgi:formate C-acetyltransferase
MADITLTDLSLTDFGFTPRTSHLRKIYFKALPEICIERSELITRFSLEKELFDHDRISILDKARLCRQVLENRAAIVRHTTGHEKGMKPFEFQEPSLFAGSTTSRFKGVPLYPEFLGLSLWPELWTISKRASNPFHITDPEVEKLNYKIFPHWMEKNILELARKRCYEENRNAHGLKKHAPEIKLLERLVFFLASKPSCISHTIPDFSRAIHLGLRKIITEAEREKND